ncbi:hypothetical protein NMY22_g4006 [Coprinellus aureogranulatus]|nr:hypothetical protein NMY22_g4006 [Coprinellus aureogranulatus]
MQNTIHEEPASMRQVYLDQFAPPSLSSMTNLASRSTVTYIVPDLNALLPGGKEPSWKARQAIANAGFREIFKDDPRDITAYVVKRHPPAEAQFYRLPRQWCVLGLDKAYSLAHTAHRNPGDHPGIYSVCFCPTNVNCLYVLALSKEAVDKLIPSHTFPIYQCPREVLPLIFGHAQTHGIREGIWCQVGYTDCYGRPIHSIAFVLAYDFPDHRIATLLVPTCRATVLSSMTNTCPKNVFPLSNLIMAHCNLKYGLNTASTLSIAISSIYALPNPPPCPRTLSAYEAFFKQKPHDKHLKAAAADLERFKPLVHSRFPHLHSGCKILYGENAGCAGVAIPHPPEPDAAPKVIVNVDKGPEKFKCTATPHTVMPLSHIRQCHQPGDEVSVMCREHEHREGCPAWVLQVDGEELKVLMFETREVKYVFKEHAFFLPARV